MKFKFHDLFLFKKNRGLLNGEDLEFFYYCVANQSDNALIGCINWDELVLPIVDALGVRIEFISKDNSNAKSMLLCNDDVFCHQNTLFLSVSDNNEPKTVTLFRHLRNAFSHYRITHFGDLYILSDINRNEELSMKGSIEINKLREIICEIILKTENLENS